MILCTPSELLQNNDLPHIEVAGEHYCSRKLLASEHYWALCSGYNVVRLNSEFPAKIVIVAVMLPEMICDVTRKDTFMIWKL